jgi:hypothetical protein
MGAFIEAENVRKTYRVGKIEVRACAASPSRCDEVSLSAWLVRLEAASPRSFMYSAA